MPFDSRWYTDSYDLYRPTLATSDSGVQTITEPGTPTSADQPCRFFDGKPPAFVARDIGVEQDFDAVLLIPASQTLRPEAKGNQPDYVEADSRRFAVMACWDVAGRGMYKVALLQERND